MDPTDAATLQSEALACFDQAEMLGTENADLNQEVEEATQDVQDAERRFYAATAYVKRPNYGIKLSRNAI